MEHLASPPPKVVKDQESLRNYRSPSCQEHLTAIRWVGGG